MPGDLGAGVRVRREVLLDPNPLGAVDGVEGVGAEQLVHRLVVPIVAHWCTLTSLDRADIGEVHQRAEDDL